jgi:hypothetical protein
LEDASKTYFPEVEIELIPIAQAYQGDMKYDRQNDTTAENRFLIEAVDGVF